MKGRTVSALQLHEISRRQILRSGAAGLLAALGPLCISAPAEDSSRRRELRIKQVKATPVALPDPPILAASGCHGPYFLRSVIEVETDEGIVGIGESYGGESRLQEFAKSRDAILGQSAFAFRRFAGPLQKYHPAVFAGIEMACLDAVGKALGRRACELLGGPVRDEVEFAAYLFYRYAADHPQVLNDPRLADSRGRGDQALDTWGEVLSPDAMAEMAMKVHQRWGFRVLKLKAGVLPPETEVKTLAAMNERFEGNAPLRIDPNGSWSVDTAIRFGHALRDLPLEYYEDPVSGQSAMADVRAQTRLAMATNSCVSRWEHVENAVKNRPIDVVLGDVYWYGGMTGVLALGQVAESLGWGLGYHSNNHAGITMAAMVHLAAATPQLTYAADTHYVWLPEGADLIEGPALPIQSGRMQIPAGPGLGVQLDRDKLARAHETYRKCGMRDRDDASTMRRFQPGWERRLF
jgi:glucarate dehydratase